MANAKNFWSSFTPSDVMSVVGASGGLIGGAIQGHKNRKLARHLNDQNIAMQKETNAQNYQMWQEQLQNQWDMFNATNEYNSFANQRKLADEAGINYANIVSGGAQASSVPLQSPPAMTAPQNDIGALLAANETFNPADRLQQTLQTFADALAVGDKIDEYQFNKDHRKLALQGASADVKGKQLTNVGQQLENEYKEKSNPLSIASQQEQLEVLRNTRARQLFENSRMALELQYLPQELQNQVKEQTIRVNTLAATQMDTIINSHLSVDQMRLSLKKLVTDISQANANIQKTYAEKDSIVLSNTYDKRTLDDRVEQQSVQTLASYLDMQLRDNQLKPEGMSWTVYNGLGGWQGIQQKCGEWIRGQREFSDINDNKKRSQKIGAFMMKRYGWTRDQVQSFLNMDTMTRNQMMDNFWHLPNELNSLIGGASAFGSAALLKKIPAPIKVK